MTTINTILRQLFFRVLDLEARKDYVLLFLVCALPSGLAWYFALQQSYPSPQGTYLGYFDKHNFWPLAVINPLALWLIRYEMGRIANLVSVSLPERPPALIQLIDSPAARTRVYTKMRQWMSAPRTMASVLATTLLITALDMRELLTIYWFDAPTRTSELDWSVMYQIGVVSKSVNLLFVGSAYLVQFLITFLGVFAVAFLIAHNLFFMNRIYQRRNVTKGEESDYIRINLHDVNKCFGFRAANDAFNTQVIALILGGIFVMFSRFANVGDIQTGLGLTDLLQWPSPLFSGVAELDTGQFLQALFWLATLGIVSIPGIVKLLPRLPVGRAIDDLTITSYLREFLDDNQWRHSDQATKREVDIIAAQFAENSFWPTGDNRAAPLFFFAATIFLIILFPIKSNDGLVLAVHLGLLVSVAWLIKSSMFFLLNSSLSYVDERLATRRPDLLDQAQSNQPILRDKIFISYRRDDSAAYTRLLRNSLLKFMEPKQIFMDVETISDGADFVDVIRESVNECDTMLVVIGKQWLATDPATGKNRLFDAEDFVRLEIALALEAGNRVVPILVGQATMPDARDLPDNLQAFWRRNARRMSDDHWDYDVEELVRSLQESL